MNILNKKQFTRKYLEDNSIQNFTALNNKQIRENPKDLIGSDNKTKGLIRRNKQDLLQESKHYYEQMMFDLATCRTDEVLNMPIEKVIDTCTKLIGKQQQDKPGVEINFTFGQLVRDVALDSDEQETVDIDASVT